MPESSARVFEVGPMVSSREPQYLSTTPERGTARFKDSCGGVGLVAELAGLRYLEIRETIPVASLGRVSWWSIPVTSAGR